MRNKVIQLKSKPKCVVKSTNIQTIHGTGTGITKMNPKIGLKITPVINNSKSDSESVDTDTVTVLESKPDFDEYISNLNIEPTTINHTYDEFKLLPDEIIEQVLSFEVNQRTQDALLDEPETKHINKKITLKTSTITRSRQPFNKPQKTDPNTGMVIKMNNRTHPTLNKQDNFQTKKLLQQESKAQMPIFKGINENIPIKAVPDIKTLNIDDIPAFCLHLSERTDREKFMADNLPKIHSNVKWIEGVKISPSYKGISRAHKRIIAIAKAKGWPYVITFEDDIKIPSLKAKAAFTEAMKNLPSNWDALLGGVYDCKTHKPIGNGLAEVKGWCSLHFVLWKYTIYDAILNHHEKSHIDRYIGSLQDKHFYMTWPFVAIQYNGFSDNVNKDVNYDWYLKRFKILH